MDASSKERLPKRMPARPKLARPAPNATKERPHAAPSSRCASVLLRDDHLAVVPLRVGLEMRAHALEPLIGRRVVCVRHVCLLVLEEDGHDQLIRVVVGLIDVGRDGSFDRAALRVPVLHRLLQLLDLSSLDLHACDGPVHGSPSSTAAQTPLSDSCSCFAPYTLRTATRMPRRRRLSRTRRKAKGRLLRRPFSNRFGLRSPRDPCRRRPASPAGSSPASPRRALRS